MNIQEMVAQSEGGSSGPLSNILVYQFPIFLVLGVQKHLGLQTSNCCMKSTWHCPWKEGDGQWSGGSTGPTSNSGSIRCFPVAVLAPQLLDTPGPSPRAEGQPGGERGLGTQFWKKLILRDFILRRWRGSDVPDGGQRLPGVSPLCPGPTATF